MNEQRCFDKYGCTLAQYAEICAVRDSMRAEGKSYFTTPLTAYSSQKSSAKYRGVPFRLTLGEWWQIWQDSGKWDERSVSGGYVMCRKGDIGAYEVGNVFIDTSIHNISFAKRKAAGLPIGVVFRETQKRRPYLAYRSVNGKMKYLGSFNTPEEAHGAYLVAA